MSGKFKERVSNVLAIPQEIVSDVPRLVFDSNTTAYIENYKGISEYGRESIKINTGKYIISLQGEALEIKSMTTEEVVVEGIIKAVDFS